MNPLLAILVMALTTYLIRMLPLVLFHREITHPWVRSFLHYVPYAVLGTMTRSVRLGMRRLSRLQRKRHGHCGSCGSDRSVSL